MEVHLPQNDTRYIPGTVRRRENTQLMRNTYYTELETVMAVPMRVEPAHPGCSPSEK